MKLLHFIGEVLGALCVFAIPYMFLIIAHALGY